ncbi:MAG: DUF2156 domain-containing protein [Minisyncoccia bacterium]
MIPEFPEFKKIELSDKDEIEKFTGAYPPYSDFNFVSMWSWDISGEMRVSQLNNNLVVRFTDYLTEKQFLSFIGNNKVNETALGLLKLAVDQKLISELKLVPEHTANELDNNVFKIEEDINDFDYVYNIEELRTLAGSKFETKRGVIHRFIKKYKETKSEIIDPTDVKIKADILKLNYSWIENKLAKDPFFDIKNELIAIDRFLNSSGPHGSLCVGVFADEKLVGYSVNQIISSDYSIGHFIKSHKEGSFEFIMQETAKKLAEKGVKYFNFEQDLGIEGLRKSKQSYRPAFFLKKFNVSKK